MLLRDLQLAAENTRRILRFKGPSMQFGGFNSQKEYVTPLVKGTRKIYKAYTEVHDRRRLFT